MATQEKERNTEDSQEERIIHRIEMDIEALNDEVDEGKRRVLQRIRKDIQGLKGRGEERDESDHGESGERDEGEEQEIFSIVNQLEDGVESLKDELSKRGIRYNEMSDEDRGHRRQTRHVNKDGITPDKRYKENREGPTGQGQVKDPAHDSRLKENRS